MAQLVTFGCRLNTVESQAIRAHTAHLPDTIVVNTCAVTATAERDARHAIARLHRDNPGAPIVVTGCAVQINPAPWSALPGVTRVLGNQEKLQPEQWRTTASAVSDIRQARTHTSAPLPGLENRARAYLDIQQGCDHACTFCIIPQGRGPNRSVPTQAITSQLRRLAQSGYNEVVLTGVDLASWGRDLPGTSTLGTLIRTLLRTVPELPRLRLSSLDPAALDETFWDALANEERLMPHLHLSLQSGADLILKRMRRRHRRAATLELIAQARRLRPGLAIGADLIAGFPTETDALFAETLGFVGEAELPYLHVFPYSPRPGTPAARMPQTPPPTSRARAARLREAAEPHAARLHAALLGTEQAIVVERGARGHTEAFAAVRLATPAPIGALIRRTVLHADAAGLDVA